MKTLIASLILLAAAPTAAVRGQSTAGDAAYQFALAKMLAEEGRVLEALQAYPEAVRLTPDDPYVRIEYAELLLRMAQRNGSDPGRIGRLAEAAEQAQAAHRLAPDNVDALRAVAQIELSLSDFRPEAMAAAIEALEAVRRQTPADAQSMVTLGQIYLQQQQPDRAVEVFREVATYTPGNRMIYSFLADALHAAGRDDEAAEPLRRLLELDPRAVEARLGLARALAQRGDHRGAAELLRQAPEEPAQSREIQGELAWQLYLADDYDGALAAVEGALRDGPDETWPRFVRALSLAALDRGDEALAELASLRAADPDNLELARTEAGVLERLGRPAEAIRALAGLLARLEAGGGTADAAAEAADRSPRARLLLASFQARAGEREAAAATLEPLLGSKDDEVRSEARLSYAELLFDLDRRERALAVLDEAAGALPALRAKQIELLLRAGDEKQAKRLIAEVDRGGDLEVTLLAAQAAQAQSRWELSLPLLERAIAQGPERVQVFFMAGAAYERTGQREKAAANFKRLLALAPDFAPALNYLGYMWAERGENLAEALAMVERAVVLDPANGAYADSLGWAHFQLGDYGEARRYLELANRLLPDDPTVCEHLADLYAAVGEVARAEGLYRRALDLAAGDAEDVRRKLDRLRVD